MRTVDEQLALITAAAVTPEPVRIAISEALGLRSAERVEGSTTVPGFDQAAIDGYAVRAVDIGNIITEITASFDAPGEGGPEGPGGPGVGPQGPQGPAGPGQEPLPSLPIVGDITAGSQRPVRLQPRQAVRVHAGAPMPTLADAVLPLDWAEPAGTGGRRIRPLLELFSGDFVHRKGSDVQPGDILLDHGAVIGAAQVGLLAAVGRSKVLVYPPPRLSVMALGQELVDIDREPSQGQIRDINSYALATAGREAGADVHRIGIINGEPRRIRDIVESQLARSEVVVVTGAVGGSSSDEFREVIASLGEISVHRVAMHPGSIVGFGTIGSDRTPIFLLPANPSAALVAFEVLVRPLINIMRGQRHPHRRLVKARTVAAINSLPQRKGFIRGQLMRDADTHEFLVDPLGVSSPGEPLHLLGSHGQANALIVVPEHITHIPPGAVVEVMFLSAQSATV